MLTLSPKQQGDMTRWNMTMSNPIIQTLETELIQSHKGFPAFNPGDTVVVQVKVTEGERVRLQSFEGVVIAKRNRGYHSSFTVRKISHGVGVERVFQSYSPIIESVEIKRRGDVRRAKLYYMRDLVGRAARIREKLANNKINSTAGMTSKDTTQATDNNQDTTTE